MSHSPSAFFSFQFRGDEELIRLRIPDGSQKIRLAANLAVFDILLTSTRGGVDGRFIPLATAGTLETCIHRKTRFPSENQRSVYLKEYLAL
jgi:hypothetical protein